MKYLVTMLVLGLLMVLGANLAESSLRETLLKDLENVGANDLQKNVSCLLLCDFCGCDGSFVGDECICDCINDGEEHVKCLEELKKSENQIEFEEIQTSAEEEHELVEVTRVRRDTTGDRDTSGMDDTPVKALRKNNKRKKFNRRQRGRRFLQRPGGGRKNNSE